ncbi:Gag polyprotein [Bienertia sinuspersici]
MKKGITHVPITYEWKPKLCLRCKRLGHSDQECHAKQASKQPEASKEMEGVQKHIPTNQAKQLLKAE